MRQLFLIFKTLHLLKSLKFHTRFVKLSIENLRSGSCAELFKNSDLDFLTKILWLLLYLADIFNTGHFIKDSLKRLRNYKNPRGICEKCSISWTRTKVWYVIFLSFWKEYSLITFSVFSSLVLKNIFKRRVLARDFYLSSKIFNCAFEKTINYLLIFLITKFIEEI